MSGEATALAHPMEGLVKYHGLKDWNLRLPYHDSISVNLESLHTRTTVMFGDYERDEVWINRVRALGNDADRVTAVLDRIRMEAGIDDRALVRSENSLGFKKTKGLGFSSSAGAALAAAAYKAARLDRVHGWDLRLISRIARRLAGSACRSVTGEYSRWYAGNSDETSYSAVIAGRRDLDIVILVIPFQAGFSTEDAHRESADSPFFASRIESASIRVDLMERAIREGDLKKVGELAEQDTFELHAVTMTGRSGLLVYQPESIRVLQEVKRMKMDGLPVYFSMQTGPSVFINTYPEHVNEVAERLRRTGIGTEPIISRVGPGVQLVPEPVAGPPSP